MVTPPAAAISADAGSEREVKVNGKFIGKGCSVS
jgi:hypothetical protein